MAESLSTEQIALAEQLRTTFQPMIERYITNGITRDEILLVVARFLFNREQLCDKDCKGQDAIHFHDIHDWQEPEEKNALLKFWRKLQSNKANAYVDELTAFARETVGTIHATFVEQRAKTLEFLTSLTSDAESIPFLQSLVEDHKDIETKFQFQCSVICTLLDMHGMTADERKETNWFETFLTYFIDDYGNDDTDDSDGDDDDSDDDSEDTDEKEPSNTGDNSENDADDESEDGVMPKEKKPEKKERK